MLIPSHIKRLTLLICCVTFWLSATSYAAQDINYKQIAATNLRAKEKVVIRKNVVNGVNLLKQDMLPKTNTIYVIQHDFVLASNVIIPENSVLLFDGGSISGAFEIRLNGVMLLGLPKLLCNFTGEVGNNSVDVTWFGSTLDDGIKKLNDICKIASVIEVPKGDYSLNNTICVNNIAYKTINIYGNIVSGVDKGYCFEFDNVYYSNINFYGRVDGKGKTKKGIILKTAKFNFFKFTIISQFINCLHIQPITAFAHNDITLGVLESDYDNANLLLLDGGVDGGWLNENYFHNGYFGRNSSSSEKTTYVTGVKYTIGNRLTSKTTTFNDNIWRDISFEHINTAFWFNHTNLNIIENMRVEKCGRSLNSPLIKAYNLSKNNRINNLLYGANESLSYDVFENGIIWGEVSSPLLNYYTASYDISYKDIDPTTQIDKGYANCTSEYFSLVTPSNLKLSKNFRYKLSKGFAYNAAYADLPAIVVECQDSSTISTITITSDTDVKIFVGILEMDKNEKNVKSNQVLSTDTAGSEGMLKTFNTSKKKVIVLNNKVKKAVIGFRYNNSSSGVFKKMHIETSNCNVVTNLN